MAPSSTILLLLLYPAVVYLIPEPIAAREGWNAARFVLLPTPLRGQSEKNGRYLLLAKYVILAGLTLYLARTLFPRVLSPGITAHDLPLAMVIGMLAGVLLAVIEFLLEPWFPRIRQLASDHPALRGPWQTWTTILIVGAPSEELWRALSLLALQYAGFNIYVILGASSLAYAFAQLGGIPGRLLGIWEDVLAAAVAGIAFAILFLAYGSFLANCTANLTFNFLRFYKLKRSRRVEHP